MTGRTTKPLEEVLTAEFFDSIVASAPTGADQRDREYLIQTLLPCLVPALKSLLRAEEDVQQRKNKGAMALSIKPLDYLAKYLYRHNPRHAEPTEETLMLQRLAHHLTGR
ncbi:unnamed protein product [Aphanomyces euteiches]|uniref:Uncharacterized protein n=1 Tax=Aphanomyces euteiches TaxID=100861 RepID=A0A6G0WH90_9STRA|nr:hypothetical protein Ae201684_015180 [Aphanomyces euteiches]KAH9080047.1 hypothetical protein Ae201684P_020626 [Aphanomyces euteiches]KAH9100411.1 hypothetical protein LEN26_015854 [Aphanomyces euteiches]KAH9102476.1 hypothetical protein AeMF1_020929 [Aphanomyces euteiches]KAH9133601.1 hypothetical protein AeRB84_020382 [Aphanomyces euteiches]